MNEETNYTKEAFLRTENLVFVVVMAAVTAAAGLLPMGPSWLFAGGVVLGLGTELCYLGLRSSHPRFRRRVRARADGEHRAGPAPSERYRQLSRRSQRRYHRLRQFRNEIRANYRQFSVASRGMLGPSLERLDDLLHSYLALLHERERYYDLARRSPEDGIRQSVQTLEDDMADDAERVRSVKQRRLEVLEKRLGRIQTAREHLAVIGAQLGAIEDVVKYIHEQSWTLQDPDEVTMELNTLLEEVEETQRSVHEIEEMLTRPAGSAGNDDLAALDDELDAALDEGGGETDDRRDEPRSSAAPPSSQRS